MSVSINKLLAHLESLLKPHLFNDFSPNGLQVEGTKLVRLLVTGVSANRALIDAAIEVNADALLVHHGFFWPGEPLCITGLRYQRFSRLIAHQINLLAYHLPLDGHDKFGNNVQLAKKMDICKVSEFSVDEGPGIGCIGCLNPPMTGPLFEKRIEKVLGRKALYIPGPKKEIHSIAWSTGAAQDYIFKAAEAGADAFLTGEVSERTVAFARELGIHFYAAGHHATERYGVKALGDYLANHFKISHQFIDIDNPV